MSSRPPAGANIRPVRLFLVGNVYWAQHLAKLLSEEGPRIEVLGAASVREFVWRPDRAIGSDIVIRVGFPPTQRSMKLRLVEYELDALRRIQQVRTVFYWIGSDVYSTLAAFREGRLSSATMRILWKSSHLVGAPWFRDALAQMGLASETAVFPTTFPVWTDPLSLPDCFSVLSYVPEGAEALYGLDMIIELARRFPQVPFAIMGHRGVQRAVPANLTFLGPLSDPHPAFRASSVVLRLTRTDAIGATVREALYWGRYAIFTHPVPHTLRVAFGDIAQAEQHIRDLLDRHAAGTLALNTAGRDFVIREFDARRAIGTFVEQILLMYHRAPTGHAS